MDDIRLIEQAARILQTSGDAAMALRRAMRESLEADEPSVPRPPASESESVTDHEPSAVDLLSMGPDDDIDFEPPRLGSLPRPARFD